MSRQYPASLKRQIEQGQLPGRYRINLKRSSSYTVGGSTVVQEQPGALVSLVAAGAAAGFGSVSLGDLNAVVLSGTGSGLNIVPGRTEVQREVLIRSVKASLTFQKQDGNLSATWSGNWSVGSTATADATLSGTEVNIIASQAIGPAVAGNIAPPALGSELIISTATQILWSTASVLTLNMISAAADQTDSTTAVVKVLGYIDLFLELM